MKLPPWWPLAAAAAVGLYVFSKRTTGARMTMGGGGRMTDQEVNQVFGPLPYREAGGGRVTVDPSWVAANIVTQRLFDGHEVKLHKAIAGEFARAYQAAVEASGYHPKSVQTFVTRHILWNPAKPLSMHSFGIAVDIDPSLNPWGSKPGKLDATPAFVAAMENAGWVWGGRWKPGSRDSMHFERTSRRPLPVLT